MAHVHALGSRCLEEPGHQIVRQNRRFLAGPGRAFDTFGRIVGHRLFFNECLKQRGDSRQLAADRGVGILTRWATFPVWLIGGLQERLAPGDDVGRLDLAEFIR